LFKRKNEKETFFSLISYEGGERNDFIEKYFYVPLRSDESNQFYKHGKCTLMII